MKRLYTFDTSNLQGDLFGGVTAGVVALPLALAFGVQSGLGAAAGIYGAMVLGFFAAWLGGTSSQVSGPTGPMTVVSAGLAANLAVLAGGPAEALGAILLTFLLSGVLQIVLGAVRVGKYIRLVPYPVVSGFMTGIGIIIILLQIFPMLGHPSPSAIIEIVLRIGEPLQAINWLAVLLALSTLAITLGVGRITKRVPGTLVALITMTALSLILAWDVPRIGTIPSGLPQLQISTMLHIDPHMWGAIFSAAVALAVLGALDSLLTSLVADSMTRTRHDSERELIGQGIGNVMSAIVGGVPGAGATMRTVINVQSGGRTRISGMVHGVFLLVVLLGLGQLARQIPLAVLAGILISVGLGIMDKKGIRQLRFAPRGDAVVLVLVLIFTVFFDLIQAVALGVALASLLFMKRMGDESAERSHIGPLGEMISEPRDPDEREVYRELQGSVHIQHLHGPLHFGFTSALQDMAASLPKTPFLVLRFEEVPFMDQSGYNAIAEIIRDVTDGGTEVFVTGLQTQPAQFLSDMRIAPGYIPADHICVTFRDILPVIGKRKQLNQK